MKSKKLSAEERAFLFEGNQESLVDLASDDSGADTQWINVDFPEWMIKRLDDEAKHMGVNLPEVIRFMIEQQLAAYGERNIK